MNFGKKIRKLDVFRKVPDNFSTATNMGGVISILTVLLLSYLVINQISMYIYPTYTAELLLEQKLVTRQQMNINLDITFHEFPCEVIALDLEDSMASHHPNIGSVEKWRLYSNGSYIDSTNFELLREHSPARQLQLVRNSLQNKYGCRLVGSFTVKEVPGNFHISYHAYFNQMLIMKMEGFVHKINISHTINKLYFGTEHHLNTIKSHHPQSLLDDLSKKDQKLQTGHSSNYHIDIVPTWYEQSSLNTYYTYQYTYKHNQFQKPGMPEVVHFNYHIGGLVVQIMPLNQNLFSFMARLCAIIGGTYAIANVIHNTMAKFEQRVGYELIQ